MFSAANIHDSFIWAIALAVGYPVLYLFLTEWILRARRAQQALATPLRHVRNLILPAVAATVLLQCVMNWTQEDRSVRIAQTVMWLFIVHTALSFLNFVLFAHAKEGSWQSRVPQLFVDMVRVVIVLLCGAIVYSIVWDQDLAGLLGALGVGSLVVGLALQEPLGNLISGIMLMMERPIAVGDWIHCGHHEGAVIETTWRSVHLRNTSQDMIVVPNSELAKSSFTNFSRPTRMHRHTVLLNFSTNDAPNTVKLVLADTARRTRGVIADGGVKVRLAEYGESYITYETKLPLTDYDRLKDIVEDFRTLVWYAAKRNNLTMPYPTQTQIVVPKSELDAQEHGPLPREAIEAFPRFGLDDQTAAMPVSRRSIKHFAKGEKVFHEGQSLGGVHLILRGSASLTTTSAGGAAVPIATLGKGEFFGESALFSVGVTDVTVTALEDLEVLVLESEWLRSLIDRVPHLSREIGDVMEFRRKSLRHARAKVTDGHSGAPRSETA
jgi:small-conductance mechanosensitive channel